MFLPEPPRRIFIAGYPGCPSLEYDLGNSRRLRECNPVVEFAVLLAPDGLQRTRITVAFVPTPTELSVSAPPADPGNDLMLALQNGDRHALGGLVALYNGRLYNYVLRMLADRLTAEDIVQETWMTLYEHRLSYQPTFRFSTWLFTIARRKALSELRRRNVRSVVRSFTISRRGEPPEEMDPQQSTFPTPDASADGVIVSAMVERALARLTPAQREIVMLRDVEGFDNDELAVILGWDVRAGTLRKRIFDAREAFRRAMVAEGYDD